MEHILEQAFGKKLPQSYLDFLASEDAIEVIVDEFDYEDKYENRYWAILSQTELLEELDMVNVGKARNFECLKLYVQVFMEFSTSESIDSNVGDISRSRVEKGFVFAEENGDYLYLDAEANYSVWVYYHDGGDVKKVFTSFEELLIFQ